MKYFEYLFFLFHKGLISIMPFRLAYWYSDFLAFILRYVLHYRLDVVKQNLRNSFPGKDEQEIARIADSFYKNLSDIMIESIKGYSMDFKKFSGRYFFRNIEVANRYFEKNQDIILALSHYCNWEWGSQVAGNAFRHSLIAFYKPITNQLLDKYMIRNRTKRKISLVSIENKVVPVRKDHDLPTAWLLISDQSPPPLTKVVWTKFLNQDTAFFRGIELYARSFGMPVLYVDVQRISRGHYSVELEVLEDDPSSTLPGEITEKYARRLESVIERKPEDWLWSHRRWKRERSPEKVRQIHNGDRTWEIGRTGVI
jgi:KDO2-lipid IV(A) lauroyltransferase